jgi:hypothetical protein
MRLCWQNRKHLNTRCLVATHVCLLVNAPGGQQETHAWVLVLRVQQTPALLLALVTNDGVKQPPAFINSPISSMCV